MSLLIGNAEGKIDAKCRAFLPAIFRRLLNDQKVFYLRTGIFENCLELYPEDTWEQTISDLRQQLSPWVREEDALFRQFVAEADRIELEDNGRMLIPKRYLTAIGITSEARFIGRVDKIEIWPLNEVEKTYIEPQKLGEKMEQIMSAARKNAEQ